MLNWNEKFAGRVALMKRSSVREILKLTQQPDIISFAGGLPAPELFPVERIRQAADVVIAERGREVLQYSTTEGMPELRDFIADRMSTGGLRVTRDNLLIVSGSQQAIDLIGRVLLDEGDRLAVENPTYLGMLHAWRTYNLNYLTIPTDEDGLMVAEAEVVLQQNPKAMYLIPDFQNPQGVTLSKTRRVELAKLLDQYQAVVIEDNPYGELRYSGEAVPSLLQIDAENLNTTSVNGHVIYLGTFSKTLTPGLRLGWIVAPPPMIERLVQAKQGGDLHTSTLNQVIAYEAARDGFLDQHITHLREVYRQRRDLMLATMDEHFPAAARWTRPEGGLFLMVHLPDHIDTTELLKKALEYKVAFVPGADFFVDGTGRNTFRLNFSNARPEMIVEGIKRLGRLLKEEIVAEQA